MKTIIFFLGLLCLSAQASVEVTLNEKGMPVCLQGEIDGKEGSYFVYRGGEEGSEVGLINLRDLQSPDGRIMTPRNCKQWGRVTDLMIPENFATTPIPKNLPERELFAFSQMRAGGQVFRTEKTPAEFLANNPLESFEENRLKELRENYGEAFASGIYKAFAGVEKSLMGCKAKINSCDYYLCRESKNPCGTRGYYLAFGYQYCKKSFGDFYGTLSTRGQKWLTDVSQCLRDAVERDVPNSTACKEVRNYSVDSHVRCYSETNFCGLNLTDKTKIISMLSPELGRPQMLGVGLQIVGSCLKGNE